MRMTYQCLAITIVLLSQCVITVPAVSQTVEIKLWPPNEVYSYTVSDDPPLSDCVLHNIAVINRSETGIRLQRLEIHLISEQGIVQSHFVLSSELMAHAQKVYDLYQKGALKNYESEYHISDLFQQAELSHSPEVESKKGILLRSEYLQFGGELKTIRVVAVFFANDGSPRQSELEVPVTHYQSKAKFILPVEGVWYVATAPDPQGHHRWGIGEEFALDFIQVDREGKRYARDQFDPKDYYCYGQNVRSPANGKVIETRDGIDDTPIMNFADSANRDANIRRLVEFQNTLKKKWGSQGTSGNYVVIDHGNSEYSALVHLQKGSIRVKQGDPVKQGQVLGQVGSSGMSSNPHLHFEVVSNPDPLKQRGLPIEFHDLDAESGPRLLHSGEFVGSKASKK